MIIIRQMQFLEVSNYLITRCRKWRVDCVSNHYIQLSEGSLGDFFVQSRLKFSDVFLFSLIVEMNFHLINCMFCTTISVQSL